MSFAAIAAFFMRNDRAARKREAAADRKFKDEFPWCGLNYDQWMQFIEDVCETGTMHRLLTVMPQDQYEMVMKGELEAFYFIASTYIVEWTNSNWEWMPCITRR